VAGELIETARDVVSNTSLPSLAAVLAASLLAVVADPLHLMYDKANKFLHQGVRWDLRRLPSYWIDLILLEPPTNDETHYQEVEWLLDILISGLRTSTVCPLLSNQACQAYELLGFRFIPRLLYLRTAPVLLCIIIVP